MLLLGLLGATAVTVAPAAADEEPRFGLELEAGPAWQSKNDVQIPNNELGTRFSLKGLVGQGPWASGRLYFTWNINRRHSVRTLLAPLSYTETGSFDTPVAFADASYQRGRRRKPRTSSTPGDSRTATASRTGTGGSSGSG